MIAAARLKASRDTAAILAAVQHAPLLAVQPVYVLVTGFIASPGAHQEARAQGIVVLDLPLLQAYWVPRLKHCTSPLVDHLRAPVHTIDCVPTPGIGTHAVTAGSSGST